MSFFDAFGCARSHVAQTRWVGGTWANFCFFFCFLFFLFVFCFFVCLVFVSCFFFCFVLFCFVRFLFVFVFCFLFCLFVFWSNILPSSYDRSSLHEFLCFIRRLARTRFKLFGGWSSDQRGFMKLFLVSFHDRTKF